MSEQQTTHFGYEEVPVSDKAKRVGKVFSSVADKYDLMNDLMSLGLHRAWKRFAIGLLAPQKEHTVLDLAGGTGDLTKLIYQRIQPTGKIILADINAEMLRVGKNRILDAGMIDRVEILQANAECLPLPSMSCDRIIIGFGLRNVTDKDAALRSMYHCLKPGGKALILEFSKPVTKLLSNIYDQYSFKLLPQLGKLIANDADSYQYLAESIRKHPNQTTLQGMMENAGFEDCRYHNLSAGIVAVHVGYKY